MDSLIQELQRGALNQNVSVSDLLRKTFVVSKKLKIGELEKWVNLELNGYNNTPEVPEYRTMRGTVKALNPYLGGWQPVSFPDSKTADKFSMRVCGQTVAELESLLEYRNDGSELKMPFFPDVEKMICKAIGANLEVTLFTEFADLVRILDAVRNIVLKWSMKLEEDGILGLGMTFSDAEKKEAGNKSYNINIFYGTVHNPQIQQGSLQSNQFFTSASIDERKISKILSDINREITKLKLSVEDKSELNAELLTITTQTKSSKPKRNIIKECFDSVKRILEGAGGSIAAKLLEQINGIF